MFFGFEKHVFLQSQQLYQNLLKCKGNNGANINALTWTRIKTLNLDITHYDCKIAFFYYVTL